MTTALHPPAGRLVRLDDVADQIADGDLLLYRRRGLISAYGRGVHFHAAKAAWWDDELFCLEVRAWYGGRAVTLASQVARWPRQIDVFAVNPEDRFPHYDPDAAVAFLRQWCGCRYGYAGLFRVALAHLPLARLWLRPSVDDHALGHLPPFCSHACAMADRLGGGVDPVPHLADQFTEPADLARSALYRYRFTLEN